MTELLPVRTPSLYRFMTSTMASYSCICDDVPGTLTAAADWLIDEMLLFWIFPNTGEDIRIARPDQLGNTCFDFRRDGEQSWNQFNASVGAGRLLLACRFEHFAGQRFKSSVL